MATAAAAAAPCTLDRAVGTTIDSKPAITNAYGTRWNAARNRLAYMQPDSTGYYRLFTARPDFTDRQNVNETNRDLPQEHQGAPYWHPSGRFIFFIAQKAAWHGAALFSIPDYGALPGFGVHDDLWAITADASHAWQLTHDPNTRDQGVRMPIVSPDGTKVAWAARSPGHLQAATRRFHRSARAASAEYPRLPARRHGLLRNRVVYLGRQEHRLHQRPGHPQFLAQPNLPPRPRQRHRHAPDHRKRLQRAPDRHPHPPTGDWIVYMSTRGVDRYPFRLMLGTDLYAMRLDGSGNKRLTEMNVRRPDGSYILGDVQFVCRK